VATRHSIRLPPALALSGKAFTQMQLAVAQLAPSLDPFALASRFLVHNTRRQVLGNLDPQRLYYNAQKLALRTSRLIEALERASGARPGAGVQVSVSGTQGLEDAVERAGRRIAIVGGAGVLLLAGAAWRASAGRSLKPSPVAAALVPTDTQRPSSARPAGRARRLLQIARAS
jgi:predicted unusual protein kinase regulating ubiquinone biosynthesis (AarF/ABC1/UbiB family)